ncbi:MAG: hypothetical protein M3350_06985 [Actinomycetota bacterium]|nr:hypothetical protein [Actinomycetota bacterium]
MGQLLHELGFSGLDVMADKEGEPPRDLRPRAERRRCHHGLGAVGRREGTQRATTAD